MPLGQFPDWETCIKAQLEKGYSEESAKRICGKIESNMSEQYHYIAMLNEIENLNESNVSIIEVLKTGKLLDRNFTITEKMLEDMVENFNNNVYGTEIQVNLSHDRDGEAAGWIRALIKEGNKLLAEVEWTPLGLLKIKSKQFKFTSSEIATSIKDVNTGKTVQNVLIGVALTNIPAVKGLKAVTLSEKVHNYFNNPNIMDNKNTTLLEEEEAEKAEVQEEENENKEEEPKKEEDAEAPAEDEEEEAPAEDEKAEAPAKDEKAEEEDLKENTPKKVELTEFTALQEEHEKLKEKLDKIELSEDVRNTLLLDETNTTGFLDEELENITNFMMSLSLEQRKEFKTLIPKVQTVNLSTIGSTRSAKVTLQTEDAITELADKLLADGKAKDIREAQKMAASQISSK